MTPTTRTFLKSCAFTLVCFPGFAFAKVIFVKADATGTSTGSNWSNAYPSPHSALAEALPGDQVWVAQGTYIPTTATDPDASFEVPTGVAVYGGFSGTETLLSQRNWNNAPTVFSGPLPNGVQIMRVADGAVGVIIDGLIVKNSTGVFTLGGGLYSPNSIIQVRNCTFRDNSSYQAAGTCILIANGSATITNCTFDNNYARFTDGGGIATDGSAGVYVEKCKFLNGRGDSYASGGNGVGIAIKGSGVSRIVQCEFRNNAGFPVSGSQYPSYGGAIYAEVPISIDRCTFDGNASVLGGAVYSWKGLTITNSLFTNNQGTQSGGAVAVYYYNNDLLKMTGCTIVNNTSHETAGVYFNGAGTFSTNISGCIFWGNTDIYGSVSQSHVKKANYSCVQNMLVTRPGDDAIDPAKFPHCISGNPQFVSYPSNLRLANTSPCIDAADKTKFDQTLVFDVLNRPRFFDMPATPNTGLGSGPLPDMGCHEAFVRSLGIAIEVPGP
ncbi:MAG: right-handed parallel beta-helix repeat-containing protein [Armatimonadetes bacterium]|nr:right-handed parallel beta-helix repeat-containing protein [Armatimonadota bacterium]